MAVVETVLYDGGVRLRFDDEKHQYRVMVCPADDDCTPEVWVPSVTTITGIVDKSGPLMGWATKIIHQEMASWLEVGEVIDELWKRKMLKATRWVHRDESRAAAEFGTLLHEWVEGHVLAQMEGSKKVKDPTNPKLKRCAKGFREWEDDHEIEYLFAERKAYSVKHHYSGTVDIGADVDGVRTVVDVKSSKSVYATYYMQTEAYRQALNEEGAFGEFTNTGIIQLPRETGILTWHDLGKKQQFQHTTLSTFDAFLAAQQLYGWVKEMP